MDIKTFRTSSTYQTRANDIIRNPNCRTMIPCFLTRGPTSVNLPQFEKGKALMPKGLPFRHAIHALMKKNLPTLDPTTSLFYFINVYKEDQLQPESNGGIIPSADELCITIYENYKSDDGFLYITYCCETFLG